MIDVFEEVQAMRERREWDAETTIRVLCEFIDDMACCPDGLLETLEEYG